MSHGQQCATFIFVCSIALALGLPIIPEHLYRPEHATKQHQDIGNHHQEHYGHSPYDSHDLTSNGLPVPDHLWNGQSQTRQFRVPKESRNNHVVGNLHNQHRPNFPQKFPIRRSVSDEVHQNHYNELNHGQHPHFPHEIPRYEQTRPMEQYAPRRGPVHQGDFRNHLTSEPDSLAWQSKDPNQPPCRGPNCQHRDRHPQHVHMDILPNPAPSIPQELPQSKPVNLHHEPLFPVPHRPFNDEPPQHSQQQLNHLERQNIFGPSKTSQAGTLERGPQIRESTDNDKPKSKGLLGGAIKGNEHKSKAEDLTYVCCTKTKEGRDSPSNNLIVVELDYSDAIDTLETKLETCE